MQNGYLRITKERLLEPTSLFEDCMLLQNFTSVPVPPAALKSRLKDVDDLLKVGRKEKN